MRELMLVCERVHYESVVYTSFMCYFQLEHQAFVYLEYKCNITENKVSLQEFRVHKLNCQFKLKMPKPGI